MRDLFWSIKGGVGTTVAATAYALAQARHRHAHHIAVPGPLVTLVDLGGEPGGPGDVLGVLGLSDAAHGVADFLAAPPDVGIDALDELLVDAGPGLVVLPGGREMATPAPERIAVLSDWILTRPGPVVVDLGLRRRRDPVGEAFLDPGPSGFGGMPASADDSSRSLLVTRTCYLALRNATDAAYRADGVILLREEGRSFGSRDVEAVLGLTITAAIDVRPDIAHAVDCGLLHCRGPRALWRSLPAAA